MEIIYGKCKNGAELYAQKGTNDFFHYEKCKSNCLPIQEEESASK